MHLTNFSVNKHSKNFIKNHNSVEDGKGSKWSLKALRKYYESIGVNSDKVFFLLNNSYLVKLKM